MKLVLVRSQARQELALRNSMIGLVRFINSFPDPARRAACIRPRLEKLLAQVEKEHQFQFPTFVDERHQKNIWAAGSLVLPI